MAEGGRKPSLLSYPPVMIALMMGVLMFFATMLWVAAPQEVALIYTTLRSMQLLFVFDGLSQMLPFGRYFDVEVLQRGVKPPPFSIYWHSVPYGVFFATLSLVLMMVALARYDKYGIQKHVKIQEKDPKGPPRGRDYTDIAKKYAIDDTSVVFYQDYDLRGLSTVQGVGRQQHTAMEVLLLSGAVKGVETYKDGRPHRFRLDEAALAAYLRAGFGPVNPFLKIVSRKLADPKEIQDAVDALDWKSVLPIYIGVKRIFAFYVEGKAGFDSHGKETEAFIQKTWRNLNQWKAQEGDRLQLGYDNENDRAERSANYAVRVAEKTGKKIIMTASEDTTVLGDLQRVHMEGVRRRRPDYLPPSKRPTAQIAVKLPMKANGSDRTKSKSDRDKLLFFSEVLPRYGADLEVVAEARKGLKALLCRHLGGKTRTYPVGVDEKGQTRFSRQVEGADQGAFNVQAQLRLNEAAQRLEKLVFGHWYQFGLVGAVIEDARRCGVLAPNNFSWMRFDGDDAALWWFIQNLGMPSSVPENAGHFAHYQIEKAAKIALEIAPMDSAVIGLKNEAEKYLTDARAQEFLSVFSREIIMEFVMKPGAGAKGSGGGGAQKKPTQQSQVERMIAEVKDKLKIAPPSEVKIKKEVVSVSGKKLRGASGSGGASGGTGGAGEALEKAFGGRG